MAWLKDFIKAQFTDISSVGLDHRWSEQHRAFFLNSEAGVLKFKPKNLYETTRFRNVYLNKFEALLTRKANGENVTRDLFRLYWDIRHAERVSYNANLRTRIKMRTMNLVS